MMMNMMVVKSNDDTDVKDDGDDVDVNDDDDGDGDVDVDDVDAGDDNDDCAPHCCLLQLLWQFTHIRAPY